MPGAYTDQLLTNLVAQDGTTVAKVGGAVGGGLNFVTPLTATPNVNGGVDIGIATTAPGTFSSITITPDPALGVPSFTDGEVTWQSRRMTTTSGTPTAFLALPFPDLSPAADSFKSVRVALVGCDVTAGSGAQGGLYDFAVNTGSALVYSAALATTTGGVASPTVTDQIGGGTAAFIVWATDYLLVVVNGPSARVFGTTDVTNAGLYGGGGTLDGLTLILNVNGGGLQTLSLSGGGNTANEAAFLAAIHTKWSPLTATAGGSGGNKLVMTGTATGTIVVGAGTANTALGLTSGTYTPDSVLWKGKLELIGGT